MVAIERHSEYRGSDNVEDDDVDVRMSFDQSEHAFHSMAGVASSSPSGEP
jgi:hypothetical protein